MEQCLILVHVLMFSLATEYKSSEHFDVYLPREVVSLLARSGPSCLRIMSK